MQIPKELSTAKAIREYANRYQYDARGYDPEAHVRQAVQRGYMTPEDLVQVAGWEWQGGRSSDDCKRNAADDIKEISQVVFSAKSELLRVGALLALEGVDWTTASAILHFAYPTRYPLLNKRAMNAVRSSASYNFKMWMDYITLCQRAGQRHGVTQRELAQALWVRGDDIIKAAIQSMRASAAKRPTVSHKQLKAWISEGRD